MTAAAALPLVAPAAVIPELEAPEKEVAVAVD
jgi:hypothetical protein